MKWEHVEGQIKDVGGKFKQKWEKLSEDDLLLLKGPKETFVARLQERTGLVKDEAEKQLDAFVSALEVAKVEAPAATKT
jgi:uncharacterized protein YjbJ (UPF0337 family)